MAIATTSFIALSLRDIGGDSDVLLNATPQGFRCGLQRDARRYAKGMPGTPVFDGGSAQALREKPLAKNRQFCRETGSLNQRLEARQAAVARLEGNL